MSNLLRSFSNLTLSTPNHDIHLRALFTQCEFFTSTLDIDYIGNLSNFPNFKSLNLLSSLSGHIEEIEDCKLEEQYESNYGCQLICSTKEDLYSSIYVIVPKLNPFIPESSFKSSHIMLRFTLEELLGSQSENLLIHIENIKNSIKIIQLKNAQLFKNISAVEQENLLTNENKSKAESQNNSLLNEFACIRKKIVKLYNEFEKLQREEEKCGPGLRCVLCENNLKSIIYLPCGHLIVCDECLTQNLKTEPNSVLERRRKCLYCQHCKLKVKETRLVHFK